MGARASRGHSVIQFPIHSKCDLCAMHTEAQHVGIPMEWMPSSIPPAPLIPAVIFIGQNPGYEENREGSNFISRVFRGRPSAGKTLREAYIGGTDLEETTSIYLANGARCGPRSTTNAGVYNACAPYLIEDIKSVCALHKRVALMFCSAPAIKAFFKATTGESVTTLRKALTLQGTELSFGRKAEEEEVSIEEIAQVTCFFTYHPAYLNRGNFRLIRSVALHTEALTRWVGQVSPVARPLQITEARGPSAQEVS